MNKFKWQRTYMDSTLSPQCKSVLTALFLYMQVDGTKCFPGIDVIASKASLDRDECVENLKLAESKGFIKINGDFTKQTTYVPTWTNKPSGQSKSL